MQLYIKIIADRLEALERENTELKEENGKLRAFKSFIGNLNLQVYIKDVIRLPNNKYQFPFSYVNKKQAAVLHAPFPEAAIGKNDADFFGAGSDRKTHSDEISIVKNKTSFSAEESLTLRDGTSYDFSAIKTPYIDERGEVTQILGVSIDITNEVRLRKELHLANTELEHLVLHDALTGLAKYELLKINTLSALSVAKRARANIAIIFMDLDFFKKLNDENGQLAGDQALQEVTRRLQKQLPRESDTLARVGGDEFVVLLTGLKNPKEDLPKIMARIRPTIDKTPFAINNKDLRLEISLGYSLYAKDATKTDTVDIFEELYQKACERMHADKNIRHLEREANGDSSNER